MQGMFGLTPALATVAKMQENYDREAESAVTRQKGLQDILTAQQTYAHNEQMNPLRVQNQSLTNQGLQAGLPGIAADSEGKVLKTARDRATQQSTIDSTNSTNQLTTMKNNLDRYNKLSDTFTSIAHTTKDMSPIERVSRARMEMEAAGMKVDSPQAQQFLQEVAQNPYALLARADEAKRRAAELSPEYLRQVMMEEQHNKRNAADNRRAENVANTQAEAKRAAAEAKAKGAADLWTGIKSGKVPPDKAAVQFEFLAMTEEDPTKKAQYMDFAAKANALAVQLRQAGAQSGRADPNALGIETFPTPEPVMGQGGGAAKPDIAAQAKAAWGGYDPQKYEYRVGPNGKLQRKEK